MLVLVRYATLGALLAVFVVPLTVANGLFFPFITGKALLFRVLVEVALCGWVVLMLADKAYRPRFSWILAAFTVLTLWMFLADLLAENPDKAFWSNFERMEGWITLIHLYVFFVVLASVVGAERRWRSFWLFSLGVSAVVSLYGVLQLVGVFAIHQGGVRVDATLGNAAYLAAYLLFHIFIAGWRAIEERGLLRYVLIALIPLQAFVLLHTATRGAIFGFVLGSLAAALILTVSGKGRARFAGAAFLACLILLVGGFIMVRHAKWIQDSPTLTRIASVSVTDGATRFTIWNLAWEGFLARPVTGWGQEGFNYVFNRYYNPSLFEQEPWFDRAHNSYLDWLIAGGAPAFLAYLSLFLLAFLALWRRPLDTPTRAAYTGLLVAYGFHSLFVFDNLVSSFLFVAVLAYLHDGVARPIGWCEKTPTLSRTSVDVLAVAPACAVALVIVLTVNLPYARAGSELIYAITPQTDPMRNLDYFARALSHGVATQEIREQLVQFSVRIVPNASFPDATRVAVYSTALSEISKEIAHAPNDARLRLMRSLAYRGAGQYEKAAEDLAVAHELSPNKQSIILEQGIVAFTEGLAEAAHAFFKAAYELDTSFSGTASYFAASLIMRGDIAAGQKLLSDIFGTAYPGEDIVILAYREARRYDDLVLCWKSRVAEQQGAPSARLGLADAYKNAGRLGEARTEAENIVKEHPETASTVTAFLASLAPSQSQ